VQQAPPVRTTTTFGRLLQLSGLTSSPALRSWIDPETGRLARLPFWLRAGIVALLAALALPLLAYTLEAIGLSGQNYILSVAITTATFAMLGLGLNIVAGYAGLLDLGYAAFFAIGAYTSALLMVNFHWNFFATLPLAVGFTGLAGAILGYPTLRLRSDYLAIVTLGFGEMTRVAITNCDYCGGPNGIINIPFPSLSIPGVFSFEIDTLPFKAVNLWDITQSDAFWFTSVLQLLLALIFAYHLAHSRIGRGWVAMREDEFAAEAIGVPTLRLKLLAYVMGGMWGGLAGAFFATRIYAIDPTSFTFQTSVQVLILIVLGGLGSLPGVLIGAVVTVVGPEVLRPVADQRILIYAVALIAMMIFRPQGIWPAVRRRPKPFYGLDEEEADQRAARTLREHQEQEAREDKKHESAGHKVAAVGEPILVVEGLVQQFGGVRAVDDVSLEVLRGEIFSIIGPNGAGKTTVFNCITGVQKPKRGRVMFNGRSVRGLPAHRVAARGLGRTFQGIRLFKQMAVFENVMVGIYSKHRTMTWQALLHTPGERAEEQRTLQEARRWLQFVGLEGESGRLATELSYADQRRVELARALAAHPRLVLLDEPAAGMNPTEKQELVGIIRKIRDLGITVVLIDHDMSLVMGVSDRIAVLDQGRVIALGKPAEIQENPRVIEAYLGRDEEEEQLLEAGEA
jgi:branched-chain amino acid transport system permease protein